MLTVSVATALLMLVMLFAVRTTPAASAENAQPAAATASAPATAATADRAATLEAAFRQREAEYQAQIQQVSTLLQERQTLYAEQLPDVGSLSGLQHKECWLIVKEERVATMAALVSIIESIAMIGGERRVVAIKLLRL